MEQKKLEAENSEIVEIVRGMSISLADLRWCSSSSGAALLVTVARGSTVPWATCSPFQSALTNHLLKWRTIMTTINLKRYYPI